MRSGQQGGNPPQTVPQDMVYGALAFSRMNRLSRLVAGGERRTAEPWLSGDHPFCGGP